MSESDEVYDGPMTDEVEELSDLAESINEIEEDEPACVPCSRGVLECNFCDELNENPPGHDCKVCKGTGLRS